MNKKTYGVVRTDNLIAVKVGKIYNVRCEDDLENGMVVKIGESEGTEALNNRDVHEALEPSVGDSIALVAHEAHLYDESSMGATQEQYWYGEAGTVLRAYQVRPKSHEKFSITKNVIEGDAKVGEYLVTGDGYKLVPSAVEKTEGFCAKVLRFERVGGLAGMNFATGNGLVEPLEYVVLEVLNN